MQRQTETPNAQQASEQERASERNAVHSMVHRGDGANGLWVALRPFMPGERKREMLICIAGRSGLPGALLAEVRSTCVCNSGVSSFPEV